MGIFYSSWPLPQSLDPLNVSQATSIWVEEDDRLETGELRVVHVDLLERVDQLVHDPDADIPDNSVLMLRHPVSIPLPDITGYDHVIPEEEDVVEVDGPPGKAEEEMLPSVSSQQRHLVVQDELAKGGNMFGPLYQDQQLLLH